MTMQRHGRPISIADNLYGLMLSTTAAFRPYRDFTACPSGSSLQAATRLQLLISACKPALRIPCTALSRLKHPKLSF